MRHWLPPVGVVIPTHERPALVRAAIAAVVAQDYEGRVDVYVVHDRSVPDESLQTTSKDRSVTVLANDRRPGLAGSRNTGVLATHHPLVAFCDDDDEWTVDKLSAQVAAMAATPEAEVCSSGMTVRYGARSTQRLVGAPSVLHEQLVRSRMAMLHSSSLLIRREALLHGIGLLDEDIPGSQNEDWDLLLRAARRRPILVVDRPLVRVLWSPASHYSRRWDTKIAGLEWMLEHHPDIRRDSAGSARVYGQIAFAHAAAGRSQESLRWAARSSRRRPREWRAVASVVVASRLVSGDRVLDVLHWFGRGV